MEVIILAVIVVGGRQTHKLSLKVDDDTFVSADIDGVVVVVDGACLLQLMIERRARHVLWVEWFSNAPFLAPLVWSL